MAKRLSDFSADRTAKKRAPRRPPTAELAPDDLRAIFGRNLRVARLKCGLTQIELAAAAGMSDRYLSEIERGNINITLDTMKRLAQVVDHDVSGMIRLAQGEEERPPMQSKNKDG